MRFAYARTGGPLLDWSGSTPPSPTRAGETRSLGDFYPTTRSSSALRRYGGTRDWPGGAKGYEIDRSLGSLDVPRPGAPEVVAGYESPAPGAAVVHLGSNYMPEGAARAYGQTMLSADAAPKQFDMGLVRKASVIASIYHGAKRNHGSVFWGLLWGLAAYVTPYYGIPMVVIGAVQGFSQEKGPKQNPAMGKGTRRYRARMLYKMRKRKAKSKRKTAKRRPRRATRQRTKKWGTRRGY